MRNSEQAACYGLLCTALCGAGAFTGHTLIHTSAAVYAVATAVLSFFPAMILGIIVAALDFPALRHRLLTAWAGGCCVSAAGLLFLQTEVSLLTIACALLSFAVPAVAAEALMSLTETLTSIKSSR